jgi:dihydroflavonol-4-reductase
LDLVTGATGILGSHVALALLQKGRDVKALKRKGGDTNNLRKLFNYYNADHLAEKITWVEADITDIFSLDGVLQGVDHVYHCAGYVSFSNKDRKQLFEVNEVGTRNLVNAALSQGVNAFCFASSLATIRNPDIKGEMNEDVFWKSTGRESDYSVSKYNAEREVWRGMEEGLQAVIVNPGILLTPGFWNQSSSRIFPRCYKGNKFYSGGTSGYISARDAATIMIRLMEERHFDERFILVEGNYTYREIFTRIQGHFELPAPSIEAGPVMLRVGRVLLTILAFFTGKEPEISKAMIRSLQNRVVYSNKKLLRTLNPTLVPVPEVIESICKQYLLERRNNA